jgi:hypothetical protein
MYKRIASKRKSLFAKKAFGLAGAAALFIAVLFLAGCSTDGDNDDDPSIQGVWLYTYDYTSEGTRYAGYEEYVITGNTLTYTYWDTINEKDWGMSFSGNIVNGNNTGNTSGVIIIAYTNAPDDGTDGYYNAVYFDNLTATTVQLGNAYKLSPPPPSSSQVATPGEASTNFTWANVDDYIDWDQVHAQTRQ